MANCITPSPAVIDCNNLCNLCNFMKHVLPTSIDDELSMLELYNKMVKWAEVAIQFDEQICAEWDSFQTKFDANIEDTVRDILNQWLLDGTITDIINNAFTFPSLSSELLNGGKKLLILGDSIANGYGWWTSNKTDENDGIFAIWRKKYPNNVYVNIAVNQTTLAINTDSKPTISQQLTQITESDYDYAFLICGINDQSLAVNNKIKFGVMETSYQNPIENDYTTTIRALISTINFLRSHALNVIYIIPPTSFFNVDMSLDLFKTLAYTASRHGAITINMQNIYFDYFSDYGKKMLHDQVHPNKAGYTAMEQYLINYKQFMQNNMLRGKCVYTVGAFDVSSLEKVILSCLSFVKNNQEQFNETIISNDFIVLAEQSPRFGVFCHVNHIYGGNKEFIFRFTNLNNTEIIIQWNKTLNRPIFMGISSHSCQWAMSGDVNSISDISIPGDYILLPKNDVELLVTKIGFNNSGVGVWCHCDITVTQNVYESNETIGIQKSFKLAQRTSNIFAIYTITLGYEDGEWTSAEQICKYEGTII